MSNHQRHKRYSSTSEATSLFEPVDTKRFSLNGDASISVTPPTPILNDPQWGQPEDEDLLIPRSSSPVKSLGTVPIPRPESPRSNTSGSPPKHNPFNFQSTVIKPGGGGGGGGAGPSQRRGHRYKHSSVSINFFQEPTPRAPLPIPASLPIPNLKECYQSMSREQRIRLGWCACHFGVAILIYNTDLPFTAVKALAHLLIYDAVGATLCAAVEVLGNFNVWKQSSLHHPFGLERTEVLAGFALSVALIFMGGDIMSHAVQDVAQSFYGQHDNHHHHHHHKSGDIESFTSFIIRVILGVVATIISAVGLDNHTRISRAMRHQSSSLSSLPSILSNPSHFMTVTFSLALLLFPALGPNGYAIIDMLLTPVIAGSMCYVGWIISKVLGGMLVMSYSGPDPIEEIKSVIGSNPLVQSVSDISFWQVHHELWLCSMHIVMSGTESDETEMRTSATDLVRELMSNKEDGIVATSQNFGKAKVRWETTIDISRTTMD